MTRRRQIIRAVSGESMPQAEGARAYGVSASMVSKLLKQWARKGDQAFYTGSRGDRRHTQQ
ncbi:helix-turn-helix domain-containing protein [Nesterenkonia haasae]|uniref:helix-turn-helix domain-containing protein n=1 Tax=Nesterenkonia haasae TaxID=2587813 RepID=UPI0038B3935D|nr:helix-turn-helix domain-containing protein [Nesterenkonia haasae]